MTSTRLPHPPTTVRNERTSRTAAHRLRVVLMTNAVTSGIVGAVATVAPAAVDELLGTGEVGWIRLVGGIGFLVFGAAVYGLTRSTTATRARYAPVVSLLDGSYVIGTLLTIAAGWYSGVGNVVMALSAVLVADFAITQLWFARRTDA